MKIKTNPWRLKLIKQMVRTGQTTSFEKLMNMTQQQMYGADANKHYAQAWSMIHFFIQAENGRYGKYMSKYFTALKKGKSRRQAYDYAFKKADMAALEERWRQHVLGL